MNTMPLLSSNCNKLVSTSTISVIKFSEGTQLHAEEPYNFPKIEVSLKPLLQLNLLKEVGV